MTKRLNAATFEYAAREAHAAPHHIPNGNEAAKRLTRLPPYRPVMLRACNVRCFTCDVLIDLGATAFVVGRHPYPAPVLCYNCGVGWCIFSGSHPVEYFDDVPALGGPKP